MKINRSFFMGMLFNRAPFICARMDTLLPHVDVLDQSTVIMALKEAVLERGHPDTAQAIVTFCTSEDIGIWYQELQTHVFPKFN